MPKLKHWLIATHPWSFPASASPALIAVSYVFYLYKTGTITEVNWMYGALAFFGAIILHAAGNLIGDYHDYMSGVDRTEKTGHVCLLVTGVFKPKTILYYGYGVLLLGVAIGIYLLINTGLPLLFIGMIGVASATLYYKFKYVALGEAVIFISFGLGIALGTSYVMTGLLIWTILLVVAPAGLLIVAILHANNTRDMLQDKEAEIRTQAMSLGIEGSQVMYQTVLLVAYMLIAVAVMLRLLHPLAFLTLISLPFAVKNIRLMKTATIKEPGKIQFLDTHTAKLVLMFSVLLSVANFVSPFV